jgi:hypothetical protein
VVVIYFHDSYIHVSPLGIGVVAFAGMIVAMVAWLVYRKCKRSG